MSTVFEHAHKLDASGELDDFWMLIDGDTITATGTGAAPDAETRIDVAGQWLVPGFIDLHAHGAGGHSFDDGAAAISAALQVHRAHGTTRSVISLVTAPLDSLRANLAVIAELAEADPLVLGSHLEGPFLHPDRRGAHPLDFLRQPEPDAVQQLFDAARGTLAQVTIAPELPGASEAIDQFLAAGVTVALGHSNADFDATQAAFDRGARLVTHAFNGMPGISHRAPGPLMAAFNDERVVIELILDGLHVHPLVAGLAFREAPGRVALVSDAMAAAGSPDGEYQLGRRAVAVAQGRAVLRGTSTIAGSTLTLDRALRYAIDELALPPQEAVTAVTLIPARALGIDDRFGLLAPGFAADAVLLDEGWTVQGSWGAGRQLSP